MLVVYVQLYVHRFFSVTFASIVTSLNESSYVILPLAGSNPMNFAFGFSADIVPLVSFNHLSPLKLTSLFSSLPFTAEIISSDITLTSTTSDWTSSPAFVRHEELSTEVEPIVRGPILTHPDQRMYSITESPTYKVFAADYDPSIEGREDEAVANLKRVIAEQQNADSWSPLDDLIYPTEAMVAFSEAEAFPTDMTNLYNHNGKVLDVSKMTDPELGKLFSEMRVEDYYKVERMECIRSINHASIPNTKLFYPEPFIASPTYIHSDLGFLHILQYQYWLWFVFVFLIVFFFLTFLCVVRWCNTRVQPRRETRGVSRSKCGDLITACVPVSWATSIIVSETTDAVDYYDGFGTGEVVIGVRAYQWGWEYYYPKDLDLNYNVRPSYSTFIGNSIKYNTTSDVNLTRNNVWRFYQNKTSDEVVTPAHLLLMPVDNEKVLNFMNFNSVGASTLQNSNAFKTIRLNSKAFNTHLVHTPANFTNKYVLVNQLHNNDNALYDALNYGHRRQHNLSSIAATTNTYSSFLDSKSFNKFLTYTLQTQNPSSEWRTDARAITNRFWKEPTTTISNHESLAVRKLVDGANASEGTVSDLLQTHPSTVLNINDDSDKKKFNLPLLKLFNLKLGAGASGLDVTSSVANNFDSFYTPNGLVEGTDGVRGVKTSKTWTTSSSNQAVLPGEQSVRQYQKLKATSSNYNLSSSLNTVDSSFNLPNATTVYRDLNDCFIASNLGWSDREVLAKVTSNRTFFEAPYAPVTSNQPLLSGLEYDSARHGTMTTKNVNNRIITKVNWADSGVVDLLQGKRDNALNMMSSTYWNMFWSQSSPKLRLDPAIKLSLQSDLAYIPNFVNYADYDFRNAQALELLEDMFWESSYSGYNHYDYLTIAQNSKSPMTLPKRFVKAESLYAQQDLEVAAWTRPSYTPFIKDLSLTGAFYANSLQADDLASQPALLTTKDFNTFPLINNLMSMEDSYSTYKGLAAFGLASSQVLTTSNTMFQRPQSYIEVLNAFRADLDDFSISQDVTPSSPSIDLMSINTNVTSVGDVAVANSPTARVSNPISVRSTARNSIVTYNALQKVFRSRFDEGRSHTSFANFAQLSVKQPLLSDKRVPYEKLLGKNRESFYNTSFYTFNTSRVANFLTDSTNTHFFDFPFLPALNSDVARYLWFDWFAKWGMYEVQPSSVSKYSTLGVPYHRKHFDFNAEAGDALSDVETYFARISRSRKNYLPNWNYTPYMYTRSGVWNKPSLLTELVTLPGTIAWNDYMLAEAKWYWTSLAFTQNTSSQFTPTLSGNNIYGKTLWRPNASIQGYYYHNSNLADILTRREYLYRQYFETNFNTIHLPQILTANPQNPLLLELRAVFPFIDPITYNSEYSRDFYYNSMSFFKFLLFKNWLLSSASNVGNLPINWAAVTNYLFFYFFSNTQSASVDSNTELYKNQYRPLKKGISSMLRLHATGAVAMPIEIRLQILASSRDVIHSWSIPSAGIKIDCVPGYTSHRIMIFFVSGIYWGQCMEICGRYHHWMPIVVYFMKRDLFFLWCTHFVFKTGVSSFWDMNDRQYVDYVRFASYDRAAWLAEISKSF